jgi:hypothetical protein
MLAAGAGYTVYTTPQARPRLATSGPPRGDLGVIVEISNLALDLVESPVRGKRKGKRGALVTGVDCLHETASRVHVTGPGPREALVDRLEASATVSPLLSDRMSCGPRSLGGCPASCLRTHIGTPS